MKIFILSVFVTAMAALPFLLPREEANALCCDVSATSATQEFAALSASADFRNQHELPTPLTYEAQTGKYVEIKTPKDGGSTKAFVVKAKKKTNKYVFMFHEWWGLNDHIKQEAENYQKKLKNVNVIALDLYDEKVATTRQDAGKYMQATKKERAEAIISGVLDYAGADAEIATVGWCFGGGWSLQATLLVEKQAKACVIYYGMPEKEVARLKTLNAPVLGVFAKADKWINPKVVENFEKNMKEANQPLTVKMYEADHAFANPSSPRYQKAAAKDAHKHSIKFIKTHLEL